MSSLPELAQAIAARGTPRVFGVPGSGASLTLIDALEKQGVPFVTTYFEGSAAIMAGVTGRLSGRAGVAVAIKGPGLANMVPGLAACRFECLPVVAMAEAYSLESPLGQAHKRLDHGALVSAVTKGSRYLAEDGPGFDDMAAWAEAEVPAPVLLNLGSPPENWEDGVPELPDGGETSRGLMRLLSRSVRPLVIVGTLAERLGWEHRLVRLRIPVLTTAAAKGVLDETLAHAAGVYTGAGGPLAPEGDLIAAADLVVAIGVRAAEVLKAAPFPCPSVAVLGVDERATRDAFRHQEICGSAAGDEVLAVLEGKAWGVEQAGALVGALRDRLLTGPFSPARVFAALEQRFDGVARLVLDTGLFCTIGEHVWRCRRPDWFVSSGQGRYMGVGVPMAVGAALHDGRVPTVLAVGDGGLPPLMAELRLAVTHRLPLLVVLMSDGGLGTIRTRAIAEGLTQTPLISAAPGWVDAMEGMDLPSRRVESGDRLEQALAEFDPTAGPAFVEAAFAPEMYQEMVRGLR